jgi:CheY-like chemotaxis protein
MQILREVVGERLRLFVDPNPSEAPAARQVDVLIIDDEADVRDLLSDVISRAGYTVRTACDGLAAIDVLHDVRPNVIIMDLQMPVMNGAAFREAQRHNREWIRIPTVVMTGTTDETQLDPAVEETLRKPVRSQKILDIVRRHSGVPPTDR